MWIKTNNLQELWTYVCAKNVLVMNSLIISHNMSIAEGLPCDQPGLIDRQALEKEEQKPINVINIIFPVLFLCNGFSQKSYYRCNDGMIILNADRGFGRRLSLLHLRHRRIYLEEKKYVSPVYVRLYWRVKHQRGFLSIRPQ